MMRRSRLIALSVASITMGLSQAQATVTFYRASGVGHQEFGDITYNGNIENGGPAFVGDPFTADFGIDTQTPLNNVDGHVAYVGYVYDLPLAEAPLVNISGVPLTSLGYQNASLFQLEIIPRYTFSPGSEVELTATFPDTVGRGYLTLYLNLLSNQQLASGNLTDLPPLTSSIFTPQDTFSLPEPSLTLASFASLALFRRRRRESNSR